MADPEAIGFFCKPEKPKKIKKKTENLYNNLKKCAHVLFIK